MLATAKITSRCGWANLLYDAAGSSCGDEAATSSFSEGGLVGSVAVVIFSSTGGFDIDMIVI